MPGSPTSLAFQSIPHNAASSPTNPTKPAPISGAFVAAAKPLELELEALGAALALALDPDAAADEEAPDMEEEAAADADCPVELATCSRMLIRWIGESRREPYEEEKHLR